GDDYQEQIAEAIYNGLRNYFMQHPLQSAPRGEATAKSGCWVGDDYQEQIAEAIYNGLRNYFMQHPLQSAPRGEA
ncbi:hypothetical protein C3E94_28005, partial [Klebsiella pneumoniae]